MVFALSPVPVLDRGKQGLVCDCALPVLFEVMMLSLDLLFQVVATELFLLWSLESLTQKVTSEVTLHITYRIC